MPSINLDREATLTISVTENVTTGFKWIIGGDNGLTEPMLHPLVKIYDSAEDTEVDEKA